MDTPAGNPSARALGRWLPTTADRVATGIGLLALAGGVVSLTVSSGFTAAVIGTFLLGLAGIAFVALAFLLVGESEDREHTKGGPL